MTHARDALFAIPLNPFGFRFGSVASFEVLTAMSLKITVLWDVTLYSLIDRYRRFGGKCCLRLHGRVASKAFHFGNLGSKVDLTALSQLDAE
jgi:hypothetical protein